MCLWLSQPHGFQTWFVATVQEVTRGCRYAACRGGVLSCMCRPNSHAATSKRRYESSAGENDCAASRRKLDGGVNQLLVHSGSYLRARLPSSEHSHPFTPSWEVCFFWLLFFFFKYREHHNVTCRLKRDDYSVILSPPRRCPHISFASAWRRKSTVPVFLEQSVRKK